MADVKWIKITTDIFDDEKILLIESLPDAYAIITVWFKLLCLAGKQNNSGVFLMGKLAYTDKMLATIFRMKEATVTMALQTFEQFGMVEIVDGVITIPNWNKHQTLDSFEKKKERDRLYQAERRANQRLLAQQSSDKSSDNRSKIVRQSDDKSSSVAISDKDIDKDREKEYIYTHSNECVNAGAPAHTHAREEELAQLDIKDNGAYTWLPSGCQMVAERLPQVRVGKESIVKDNIVEYIEDVPQAETPAPEPKRKRFTPPTLEEVQDYCNERKNNVDAQRFIDYYSANGWKVGKNKMKDWKAAVRTWENNGYSTKDTANSKSSSFDTKDFFETALRRSYATVPSPTAGDDSEIKRRADALREQLGG